MKRHGGVGVCAHASPRRQTCLQDGWEGAGRAFRAALKKKGADSDAEDEEDAHALPELFEGQVFSAVVAAVREGKTSPPKRFSEDTLLAAMETAGQEEMPEDAERKGLGTPATRAGIIEKLVRTGFVERKKKLLIPTGKGENLIAILPEEIKSPLLTAEWEQKLKLVERAELTDAAFMDGIAALTQGFVAAHAAPIAEYASLFAAPPKGDVVGNAPAVHRMSPRAASGFSAPAALAGLRLWKDNGSGRRRAKRWIKRLRPRSCPGARFFSDLKSSRTGKDLRRSPFC